MYKVNIINQYDDRDRYADFLRLGNKMYLYCHWRDQMYNDADGRQQVMYCASELGFACFADFCDGTSETLILKRGDMITADTGESKELHCKCSALMNIREMDVKRRGI